MKKNQFNEHIKSKQIQLSKARLIPTFKTGEEMALTSVLLASFKFIREFREDVFGEIGLARGGKLYAYTEVSFDDFPECRLDGMVLVVKSGVIKDVAIFEMKNGKDLLGKEQLDKYQRIAKQYKIPKFVTISNQFVSDSSQSPVDLRILSGIEMRHFSWPYLLTLAHLLVFKNTRNIEDSDQKSVMAH
jgi:hypothetical protein